MWRCSSAALALIAIAAIALGAVRPSLAAVHGVGIDADDAHSRQLTTNSIGPEQEARKLLSNGGGAGSSSSSGTASRSVRPLSALSVSQTDFTDIVAMWNIDTLQAGLRQQTLYNHGTLRIDVQGNGDFTRDVNGRVYRYRNVAVQVGRGSNNVIASVNIPTGQNVGARLIRRVLLLSQSQQATLTIAPPDTVPPGTPYSSNSWLI